MPAFCIENDEKLGMSLEVWYGSESLVWTRNFGMDPEFWYGPESLVWAWKFGMGLVTRLSWPLLNKGTSITELGGVVTPYMVEGKTIYSAMDGLGGTASLTTNGLGGENLIGGEGEWRIVVWQCYATTMFWRLPILVLLRTIGTLETETKEGDSIDSTKLPSRHTSLANMHQGSPKRSSSDLSWSVLAKLEDKAKSLGKGTNCIYPWSHTTQ